jgi:hypothetical protein
MPIEERYERPEWMSYGDQLKSSLFHPDNSYRWMNAVAFNKELAPKPNAD